MKYIITILLSVCFYCSFGQQIQYTPMTAAGYQFKYGKFDSGLAIPFIDTFVSRGTLRPGSLVCRPQDTLFYMFNGFNWNVQGADVAALVAKINTKVDSVIVHGDTLNYWINGVSYGQVFTLAGSQGLQSVITTDPRLTADVYISSSNHLLTHDSVDVYSVTSYKSGTEGVVLNNGVTVSLASLHTSGGNISQIIARPDSIALLSGSIVLRNAVSTPINGIGDTSEYRPVVANNWGKLGRANFYNYGQQNFADANLSATADRYHNWKGFNYFQDSIGNYNINILGDANIETDGNFFDSTFGDRVLYSQNIYADIPGFVEITGQDGTTLGQDGTTNFKTNTDNSVEINAPLKSVTVTTPIFKINDLPIQTDTSLKVVVIDTTTGQLKRMLFFPGGSGGSASPAPPVNGIQVNTGSAFTASPYFTYDTTNRYFDIYGKQGGARFIQYWSPLFASTDPLPTFAMHPRGATTFTNYGTSQPTMTIDNPADIAHENLVINGHAGGLSTGYGTMQAGITGTASETGMYFNNTGTGGRNYNMFSTSDASSVGGGNFIIADATTGATKYKIDNSGNTSILAGTTEIIANNNADISMTSTSGQDLDLNSGAAADINGNTDVTITANASAGTSGFVTLQAAAGKTFSMDGFGNTTSIVNTFTSSSAHGQSINDSDGSVLNIGNSSVFQLISSHFLYLGSQTGLQLQDASGFNLQGDGTGLLINSPMGIQVTTAGNTSLINSDPSTQTFLARTASGSTQDVAVFGKSGFGDFAWIHDNGNFEGNSYKQPLFTNAHVYADGSGVFVAGDTTPVTGNTVTPYQISSLVNNSTTTNGVYTPTLTNVTNVSSSTANQFTYSRQGNIVTYAGSITITTTLAVASEVDFSLPIASAFSSDNDLNGTGTAKTAVATNVINEGDSANDRAECEFIGLAVGGSGVIFVSGQYVIK